MSEQRADCLWAGERFSRDGLIWVAELVSVTPERPVVVRAQALGADGVPAGAPRDLVIDAGEILRIVDPAGAAA